MEKIKFRSVGIGEVLFDVLPSGQKMSGGAPANFAYVATQLGDQGIVLSRVGIDTDGQEIVARLRERKIDTSFIQTDKTHETGTVRVSLTNGQPEYEIIKNAAWDHLKLNEKWKRLAKSCDAVCFGTLGQRNLVSKRTIQKFVALTKPDCLRVFDLNLRQNFYNWENIRDSLRLANVLKINHEELPEVVDSFAIVGSDETVQTENMLEVFDLKTVCLTRGGNGSLLVSENDHFDHQGKKTDVADTIGAGDAFAATMTHGLLRKWSFESISDKANDVGAFVASKDGAMPDFSYFC